MGKEFCEFQLEYWLVVSMQAMASTFYFYTYRVFFPLIRKVWKMTFWKVPSACWLILQLPTSHAGRWNFP